MYVDKHTYIYYRFLGKWIMIWLLHFQTSCWSFTLLLYLLFPATYVEPSPFSNFPHQIICIKLLTSLFLPALRNGPFLLSWLLYLFHDLWRFEARCFPSERRCDTCFSGSRGPHSMWSFPVLSFCLLCSLFHFSLQLRYHISTHSSTIEGHFGCFSQA